MAWPLSGLRGLPLLGRTITATSKVSKLWPILRTIGFSLVALALFGGLFASGDALFGSWAEALIPDLGWDTIVARTFVLALVAGVALTGAYLALNPPPVDGVTLPESRRAAHRWEWGVPVGHRRRALRRLPRRAGHGDVGRARLPASAPPGSPTPSTCTRASASSPWPPSSPWSSSALTMHVAARDTARDRVLLRVLLGALCVLTLAVVASALYRMSLYQDAFGYTVLRVFVDGFELWLGLVVVFLLVAGRAAVGLVGAPRGARLGRRLRARLRRDEPGRLGRRAQHRPVRGGLEPRHRLPATLGADATPVIVERLPAEMASCLTASASSGPFQTDDWLAWNLGRSRAATARDSLPAADRLGHGACTPYETDDYRRPADAEPSAVGRSTAGPRRPRTRRLRSAVDLTYRLVSVVPARPIPGGSRSCATGGHGLRAARDTPAPESRLRRT